MNRLLIVARLKEGAHQRARQLIADGPPRLAHEHYFWTRGEEKVGVGLGL